MNKSQPWWIFKGEGIPSDRLAKLPSPPAWRSFTREERAKRGQNFQASPEEINLVNAALYLRRPLLITGKPGIGKSTLAYAVANDLGLDPVLVWSITTRSTLQQGLYRYDAIGRLQAAAMNKSHQLPSEHPQEPADSVESGKDVGAYFRLGPLGTALVPGKHPRILLIDEIDKSDIDLPNDLLNVFEEGEFEIPELARLKSPKVGDDKSESNGYVNTVFVDPDDDGAPVKIERGRIRCSTFPLVIMTSNGEREFPPAFLRRCIQLELQQPSVEKLAKIVEARIDLEAGFEATAAELIRDFVAKRDKANGDIATDQLLNALYMAMKIDVSNLDQAGLREILWKALNTTSAG